MIIREARREDLDAIVEICKSVQVNRTDDVKTGLVEYMKERDEFILNPHFLVAETDRIIGYAYALPEDLVPESPCSEYLARHSNYILWDQWAVRDESLASARAAVRLTREQTANEQKIIAFVAQRPFNERSHSMLTKFGFVPDEYITVDGILLRAYVRDSARPTPS